MQKKTGFTFNVDEFEDYDWLFSPINDDTEDKDIFSVREDTERAAKLHRVSPQFLKAVDDALRNMADEIMKAFRKDLTDMHDLLSKREWPGAILRAHIIQLERIAAAADDFCKHVEKRPRDDFTVTISPTRYRTLKAALEAAKQAANGE